MENWEGKLQNLVSAWFVTMGLLNDMNDEMNMSFFNEGDFFSSTSRGENRLQ